MRRKIIDEVSISEMLGLRREGATNQEIADRLECSLPTVYKHIGNQPPGLRGHYKRTNLSTQPPETPKQKAQEPLKSRLRVASITHQGAYRGADFEKDGDKLFIRTGGMRLMFEMDEFQEFAKDVVAVAQEFCKDNSAHLA